VSQFRRQQKSVVFFTIPLHVPCHILWRGASPVARRPRRPGTTFSQGEYRRGRLLTN
jgi:hypothetical protein